MRFPKAFRRRADGLPPWAALDQEALRISAAMEHVQDHGNLDDFPGTHNEKLALMLTASRQGLVTWNRATQGYELTSLGRERLGMANILRKPSEPMNLAPAAGAAGARWTLGSSALVAGIAGVAIGAAAMAVLPGGSSKHPPRDRAAIVTASKPPDAAPHQTPQAQHQTPQAQPPHQADEASAASATSAARNPGIPCTAGKCLETGGAEQATRPAPEPAANAAAPSPSPSPSPPPPPQTEAHSGESGAAGAASGGTIGQEAALTPPQPASSEAAAARPTPPAPAEATRARKSSRSARRSAPQEAVSATALDQPGYAQSTEQTPRAAARSTRHRHAATEQRRTSKSRRDYVEENGPGSGVTAPRYGEDEEPVVEIRRYRGDHDRRRGWDEEPPGYAYRESPPFGYRPGPPRFGPFDWLFR